MKKFTMANLAFLLGLIQTLVNTTKSSIEAGYNALVGALGNDKNGNAHTVKSYVDEKVAEVNADNSSLAGRVEANETAISTINGDASTEGSFKKYFADMWDNLTKADGGTIDKLNEIVEWFKGLNSTDPIATTLVADVASNKTAVTTTLPQAIKDAQDAAEGKVTELANGAVATNTAAIASINNESTGILAQAKSYADNKITSIEAYTEAEIQEAWNEVFGTETA